VRLGALVCVASLGGLCACEVADEAAGKQPAATPVADAGPVIPPTPTDDAGIVSPADAAYDGLYPDVTEAGIAYVLTPDTVLDQTNHLMWQRSEPGRYFDRVPTEYCAGLALGGFNDWRPATIAELTTLLVRQPECPLLDHDAFPGALCDWYISSELINQDQYNARMLDFASGVTKTTVEVNSVQAYSTRCVRTSL